MRELYAVFIEEAAQNGLVFMEPIALVKCEGSDEARAKIKEAIGPFPGIVVRSLRMNDLGQWLIGAFTPLREAALRDGLAWCTEGSEPFR